MGLRQRRRRAVSLAVAVSMISLTSAVVAVVGRPAEANAATIGGTRASAYAAYQNTLKPALAVPMGWTGNTAGCVAGSPSVAAQDATLTAVKFFRDMAGLAPVSFNADYSAKAQQAALMMYAENAINHNPPSTFRCYSTAGYQGADNSNLYLGLAGARAVAGYMDDPGSSNTFVGHRRWILYPPQSVMGSGSTCCSNALYVFGAQTAPASPPAWVAWPTPGYFPFQVEPEGRWSLSASVAATDFSKARVSVTSGGVQLPVTVHTPVAGYGNPTLVWQLTHGYATGRADRAYNVSVTNIVQNGVVITHQYTVNLIDAEVNADQTISFPALANRVYGDPDPTATATSSSGLPVRFTSTTTAVCTTGGTNGATIGLLGAGTCTIRADQSGDAIRNPAAPVLRSFAVTKKPLTVRAVDVARPVGAANPTFAVTYTGFAYAQTLATSGVTGSPACATDATAQSPAGAYPISCTLGTLAAANYSFTLLPGTLTVLHSYVPLTPARLVETRPGRATVDGAYAGAGPMAGGATLSVTVTGRGGVPATGVGAVVLNVTAVGPSGAGYLTVWPTGAARPLASNLNTVAGQTVANLVIAKVGANGQVNIYNGGGATDLVVDVAGWMP